MLFFLLPSLFQFVSFHKDSSSSVSRMNQNFFFFPGKKDNLSDIHFVKLMFHAHGKLVFLMQLCKYQVLSYPVSYLIIFM